MPMNASDWHSKTFQDAAWWRAEADKWERLSASAEEDGDADHADRASSQAANCRQNARLKEVDQ